MRKCSLSLFCLTHQHNAYCIHTSNNLLCSLAMESTFTYTYTSITTILIFNFFYSKMYVSRRAVQAVYLKFAIVLVFYIGFCADFDFTFSFYAMNQSMWFRVCMYNCTDCDLNSHNLMNNYYCISFALFDY